jgi:hypothetical protein
LFHFLMVLLPALALTAITRDGYGRSLVAWIIVAVFWGALLSIVPLVYGLSIPNHLAWLGAIVDEEDLHRLIAWARRWYNCRVVALVAGALTLGTVVPFYLLVVRGSGVTVPVGSLYAGAFVVFIVMQNAYCISMMTGEAYNLSTCNYELYRLSPADSVLVRRSLHGYNQLAALNVAVTTAAILFTLLLFPADSGLVWPVVLFLLLVEYVSTGFGLMLPRLVLGRIIGRTKEAEMRALQIRLNNLLPRVGALTEDEREELSQLRESHDAIRDSPDNLLPLGAILRNVGALLLSTVTILAAASAEEWIAGLVKLLRP